MMRNLNKEIENVNTMAFLRMIKIKPYMISSL